MEKEPIYRVLIERGYSPYTAQLAAEELAYLSTPLNTYLQQWIENETFCEDFSAEGYSIRQLQTERRMNYPAALLTMDWLLKQPEQAQESLGKKIK